MVTHAHTPPPRHTAEWLVCGEAPLCSASPLTLQPPLPTPLVSRGAAAAAFPMARTTSLCPAAILCCAFVLVPCALGAGLTAQDLPLDKTVDVDPATNTGAAARQQLFKVAPNFVTLATVTVQAVGSGSFRVYVGDDDRPSTRGECTFINTYM